MIITYRPDDGDKQRWDWEPDRVRTSEAAICEKQYGDTWDKFKIGVMSGQATARRVLLWHLLRRDHHTLRFGDVPDFYMGELLVEFSRQELGEMRARIEKSSVVDSERDEMLTALDVQMAEAPATDEPEPVGKAESNSATPGTGEPSPKPSTSDPGNSTA